MPDMWIDRFTINTTLRFSTQHLARLTMPYPTINGEWICGCGVYVCCRYVARPYDFLLVLTWILLSVFAFFHFIHCEWVSECCFLFPFSIFLSILSLQSFLFRFGAQTSNICEQAIPPAMANVSLNSTIRKRPTTQANGVKGNAKF